MISTSPLFKEIMEGREYRSRIEVIISNGTDTLHLVDKDVVKDSVSVNWRATNNKSFSLGTCYATAMSFSSFQDMSMQIEGDHLVVIPTLFYDLGNGTEQRIDLGVFICDEPVVFMHTTSYECYDSMLFFDQKTTTRFTGTPYNLLTFICSKCGVELGSTAQQISAMPNSQIIYTIDPSVIATYRDALAYISMLLGGYCLINRDGRLEVRHFHTISDMELIKRRRISTAFGGYKTCFSGVMCRFLANQNYEPYEYITENEGLILDLGDIPIVENTPVVKNGILKSLYDSVLAFIEYYPCDIEMAGDPSIEAGDMITTKDRFGYDRNIILTSVTFNWRRASTILSEGSNPKIEAVNTAQKRQTQRSEKQAANNAVVTATYVNADVISVGSSTETIVSNLRFNTNRDLTAIFGAEIPVYSTGSGYVDLAYYDGGIRGDKVRAQVHEGYNLITLVNHLYYDAARIVLLQLKAQTAPLTAGGVAPTLTIDQNVIRTYIFAQGIETEAPWDGIISISENVAAVATMLAAQGLTESVSVIIDSDRENAFSATLAALATDVQAQSLNDTMVVVFKYGDHILRAGMGHRAGMGRMFAPLPQT